MKQVELFYDFSCPYAYLASTQVRALCARLGVAFAPKPMLLGGVFKALGVPQDMAAGMPPAKARHNLEDMHRWARYWGVPLVMPPSHPQRTVRALRVVLAAPEAARWGLSERIFRAYWVDGRDITAAETLGPCAEAEGLDAGALLAAAESPEVKQALFTHTDEAVQRGVFGAPTFFLDGGEMFWGQDRLLALAQRVAGEVPPSLGGGADGVGGEVRVIFDVSSPFAYVGVSQVEALCARWGARLVWHPVLLGGLFKQVGTPDVPLLAMSAARSTYQGRDLTRAAAMARVPFAFNSRFPLRTITAQRLIVAALEDTRWLGAASALIKRLYRAAWADDQDVADIDTLRRCLDDVGLDPQALLEAAATPAVKARLFDLTEQAASLGAFGAPTFLVNGAHLLWGQDRLALVGWLLAQDAGRPIAHG